MTTLTIELPETLITELKNRYVSTELLHQFIIKAIKDSLRTIEQKTIPQIPTVRQSDSITHIPTIAEFLVELHEINAQEPIELEQPQRIDRVNSVLEMTDEFFI